ncbi:MAG: GNAT family protein [Thermomicrobiales bacterium]
MYAISTVAERHNVGAIGYWEGTFEERPVHECGWSIVSGSQGKGFAREALLLLLAERASIDANLHLYAFPSIENEASNALCRTSGFRFERSMDFEFPPGHTMRCNIWTIDAASNP